MRRLNGLEAGPGDTGLEMALAHMAWNRLGRLILVIADPRKAPAQGSWARGKEWEGGA